MRGTRVASAVAAMLLLGAAACTPPGTATTYAVTEVDVFGAVTVRVDGGDAARDEHWQLDPAGHVVGPAIRAPLVGPRTESCAAGTCYRVVPGRLRVESGGDATGWTAAWEITGADYEQLAKQHPGLTSPRDQLSSTSLLAREVPGGHVVFVANGRDGLLYRSVDGRWHRKGIPHGGEGVYFVAPPRLASDPAPADPSWVVAALVATLIMLAGVITMASRRTREPRPVGLTVGASLTAGLLSYAACQVPDAGMLPSGLYAAMLVCLITTVALVVVLLTTATPTPTHPDHTPG